MTKNLIFKISITILVLVCFLVCLAKLDSPLERFILLSSALFSIGVYGLVSSRNAIRVLMSIELILNAVNINLVSFSTFVDSLQIKGQVFAIFVMAVAACEAAIALAIIIALYRNISSVDMEKVSELKF